MKKLLAAMGVGVICFCASNIARADEALKFRIVMHATSNQTQDVGDVDGHTMSLSRFSGLALFPDGSVGTANFTFTGDYIKGTGTFLTYFKATIFPEFPISVLSGTGRFEGAKGDGSQTGERLTPLSSGAEMYANVVINLKK